MPHDEGITGGEDGLSSQGAQAREKLLLLARLDDVLHQLGVAGAADLLGVDRKTVWRAKQSGRVDGVLRKALLRQAKAESEARDATSRQRLEALETVVQKLAEPVSQARERLGQLQEEFKAEAIERQRVGTRLGDVEAMLKTLGARLEEVTQGMAQPPEQPEAAPEQKRANPVPQTTEKLDKRPAEVTVEAAKLLGERDVARAARDAARSRMERAATSSRVLEVELALIQVHGLTLPPGEEWSSVRRSDEVSWRWRALEQSRTERQRLERRRLLRRVLTLGLWWR